MNPDAINVLVLRGGPDRERAVSFLSGAAVAAALREAGHQVTEGDIGPDDTAAVDAFAEEAGRTGRPSVVFPALHGRWGEGGGVQALLERVGVPYVGCRPDAARLCMEKTATKAAVAAHGVRVPRSELLEADDTPTLDPPVVLKPNDDGSSIDLAICRDTDTLRRKWQELSARNPVLMAEQYVAGKEVTVGWVGGETLPPIWIVPAAEFYDYDAKYERDDTAYRFEIDEPDAVLRELEAATQRACHVLGTRHLARADFIVDADHVPWLIEVNTMPGFTDHSLLPMAARHTGQEMPALCDRLVRLAMERD